MATGALLSTFPLRFFRKIVGGENCLLENV